MTLWPDKKAGCCTRCGLQLLRKPAFKGDGYFPEDSVRVPVFEKDPTVGMMHIDLCGDCKTKFGKDEYAAAAQCLMKSLQDGIERARRGELEEIARRISTRGIRLSIEEVEGLVEAGKVRMKRWTKKRVKELGERYGNGVVIDKHGKSESHVSLGRPLGALDFSARE